MNLYDTIIELLRIQSRQDTLNQKEILQVIAVSMGDTTQTEDVTVHCFSNLPKLTMGPNSSPLDGVILKVLRVTWDSNSLSPKLWTQGYRQRKVIHSWYNLQPWRNFPTHSPHGWCDLKTFLPNLSRVHLPPIRRNHGGERILPPDGQ